MTMPVANTPTGHPGLAKRFGNGFLRFCLPTNSKRSLLLTSLFVEIAKISPTHEQCLRELNDKLKIASHVDAMRFPASLHGRFWEGVDVRVCNQPGLDQASAQLLNRVPVWMRYAPPERMLEEIREVVKLGRSFHSTAA